MRDSDRELANLWDDVPADNRYSYIFEGNGQVLDQMLVSKALTAPKPEFRPVHMNSEFVDQQSDHDPPLARLRVTGELR